MKKQLIFSLIIVLTSLITHAQEHAINAANFIAERDIEAAETEMKIALQDEKEKNNPYTWHVYAFLLKEQFKQNISGKNEYRSLAILAAKKSLKLDKENTFQQKTNKILNYLAATYLKEAFLLSKSNDTTQIKTAIGFYNEYEFTKKITTPDEDFMKTKHEVLIHMANQYEKLYYKNKSEKNYVLKAIKTYENILQKDSLNYQSNYNVAVDYYNLAVDEISKIDANTPFWELILIQEQSIELFKKSLPYMTRAHQQNSDRIHSLKGLMQIYRALGDEEKYLSFKQKTKDKIRNQ